MSGAKSVSEVMNHNARSVRELGFFFFSSPHLLVPVGTVTFWSVLATSAFPTTLFFMNNGSKPVSLRRRACERHCSTSDEGSPILHGKALLVMKESPILHGKALLVMKESPILHGKALLVMKESPILHGIALLVMKESLILHHVHG
ncbi:hypothetical protein RRG08_025993 [Elysia crispata]|uniref:Uncharacterized protein n=1 Tax=Elysia crispata TaxID=231223 RepID=A0AAE1EBV8_9GAST|nr:hypothetical protein RRG08_025993 [Elysia crispata]